MAEVLVFANDNTTILNFRVELLKELTSNGDHVTIAVPQHGRNEVFRSLGCTVVETPVDRFGKNPLRELATLIRFVRIIRRTKPDVVLTYTVKPNIYGGLAAQLCRVPYIATVTGLGVAFQSEGLLQKISTRLQQLAFRRAKRVMFQNQSNLDLFTEKRIVKGNSMLLPGSGVNLELHRLEPYPSSDGPVKFVIVSRVRRDKGYVEFFEMARLVGKQHDDVEFHVVGWFEDESYRSVVSEMESNHPVVFHGEVPQEQVHEIIAGCHAMIHPSHHEGMANVVLEASAAGRPSIVSDIPGCREAVADGETGFLVPPKNPAALTNAVNNFLTLSPTQREEMGLGARKKMESTFDRKDVVARYVQAIGS